MSSKRIMEFNELAIRYMCRKCDSVLKNPVQLPCGHLMCEQCFDELSADKTEVICRCGIELYKSEVFPDMSIRRELQNIKVYCTNKEHGCEEVIPWEMLQDHILTSCKYVQTTEIPNNMKNEKNPTEDHDNELSVKEDTRDQVEGRKKVREEACATASIREDFERLSECRKKTLEDVRDLKEQNQELEGHISQAVQALQNKLTLNDGRLGELQAKLQLLSCANYEGDLVWKIQDYSRRRQEVGHGINSAPFYTGCYGYKMCGRIYLNGDGIGTGTHLSFYFVIMKGEYDALLQWPFQQSVTMTLIDQDTRIQNVSDTFQPDPESTSFRKPETEMNVASGCPQFIAHNVLETPTYLQDDTIFLQIKVDVNNIPDLAETSDQGQVDDVKGEEEDGH